MELFSRRRRRLISVQVVSYGEPNMFYNWADLSSNLDLQKAPLWNVRLMQTSIERRLIGEKRGLQLPVPSSRPRLFRSRNMEEAFRTFLHRLCNSIFVKNKKGKFHSNWELIFRVTDRWFFQKSFFERKSWYIFHKPRRRPFCAGRIRRISEHLWK